MNWWKQLKGKIRLLEPLRKHTTFKIGGAAKFFVEPEGPDDLRLALELSKNHKIPIFVLGKGSNLLISDNGLEAMVLRLSAPYFRRLIIRGNCLELSSGVLLNEAVLFAQRYGLFGLEFLAGIPGTIGGALAMNAGVSKRFAAEAATPPCRNATNIGELVKDVTVMDYDGNIKTLKKQDIRFGYRESNLAGYIILSARLDLVKKNKDEIDCRIKKYISYRIATQDLSRPSAGCIFKNPVGYSAGKLIDLCGLKGKSIQGACVSKRHANFILNTGQARSRDVLKLMDLIKEKVRQGFNIILEPEIKIWK